MQPNKLIVVDGYSFLFRAYYSMPALTRPSDNTPVGAVYGFVSMIMKLLLETKPTHVVVVFDSGQKNFRHQIYDKYKANRQPPPEDLIPQFALVRKAASALNIPVLEEAGYEADDVIATLSTMAKAEHEEVLIVSSDKDLMQLINGHVKMYDAVKSKVIEASDVVEKFGVEPAKIRDLLALVGDVSDNVPGINGIGPKTAAALLNEFGDIEGIYANLHQIKQDKRRSALEAGKGTVELSTRLVSLVKDLKLRYSLDDLKTRIIDSKYLLEFLHEQGFKSLELRAKRDFGVTENELVQNTQSDTHVLMVKNKSHIDSLIAKANYYGKITIYLQPNFTNHLEIKSVHDIHSIGIVIDKSIFYIPFAGQEQCVADAFCSQNYATFTGFCQALSCVFEDDGIVKVLHDQKLYLHLLGSTGQNIVNMLRSVDDIMLMSYDLGSGRKNIQIEDMFKFYFDHTDLFYELPITKARAQFETMSERDVINYVISKVHLLTKAHDLFSVQLVQQEILEYHQSIDKKLARAVFEMEEAGVKVDQQVLLELNAKLGEQLKEISQQIYKLAGEEFNIASTKQLSEILFYKMNITPLAQTGFQALTQKQ